MTTQAHQVCLLLGSNIQPEKNLALAVNLLKMKVKIIQLSSVWESLPVGSIGPNFLNLAILLTTPLEASELKETVLRPLETQLGRVRSVDKNAPRPIDLDIIIFDSQLLDSTLWRYAHMAVPIGELLPDYQSDQGLTLRNAALQLAKITSIQLKPDLIIGL